MLLFLVSPSSLPPFLVKTPLLAEVSVLEKKSPLRYRGTLKGAGLDTQPGNLHVQSCNWREKLAHFFIVSRKGKPAHLFTVNKREKLINLFGVVDRDRNKIKSEITVEDSRMT